jgi:hypothetical protein
LWVLLLLLLLSSSAVLLLLLLLCQLPHSPGSIQDLAKL